MTVQRDRIYITVGDPAGIGPEIVCKALADLPPEEVAWITVIGTDEVMRRAATAAGTGTRFLTGPGDGGVHLEDVPIEGAIPAFGVLDPVAGDAAFRYIRRAVELATSAGGCIVTAPINKEALNGAGHHYDGHTGMLQKLTNAPSSFMLLASERLSTIHVSTHVSLLDAVARVKVERVLETIRAGHKHLRRIGVAEPRIAVAGLNPHCGEHGLFGDQDEEFIAPAVRAAQAQGIKATGPISPDTVFYRASRGEFDLVVAQYHDQGHIPTKLIAFDTTVNVSLGLPLDRTSVDHGTAFDIAGTGQASHVNMLEAIAYAKKLADAPRRVLVENVS